jgi:PHD/YefM family antitoxin component YafN of YafNO toxin-antitoxin module
MRTMTAEKSDTKMREVIDASRTEPVAILDNGVTSAIVLSPSEFARLDGQDRIRREAKARLLQTIAAIHKDVTEGGLTEEAADRLIAEDIADGR